MDLEAIKLIEQLKHRYSRALDTKSWVEFADTMVPDVTATYSEYLTFDSRDTFVSFLANTLGNHVITEHQCGQPEITVTGDTAVGVWFLADTTMIPEDGMLLRGSAYYHDRYKKCSDGNWRITHTGYERTWESVAALSDWPSFRLTSNKWAMAQPPPTSA
ncbi:nuclear transport factor 2 family protein [Rhodococcus sp. NPDC049939]|uniref:nuclear transport factor 2 family protein n=1 Tax=Rhodococcus sp. NPDC049939 TaxID=3155511 RepID=UPI00340E93F5